jgi:hypothetical protein
MYIAEMTQTTSPKYPRGTPRKHHYVPRGYLAGFCESGTDRIAVYDRERNQFRDRQSVSEVAHIKDYYSVEQEDGTKDFRIEAWLATLESDALKIIRKVDRGLRISSDDRQVLSVYAAFQFTRTPTYQDRTDSLGAAIVKGKLNDLFRDEASARATMRSPSFAESTASPAEMVEFVKELDVDIMRIASLDAMVNNAPEFAEGLLRLDWTILRRPSKRTAFITTDSPFTLISGPEHPPAPYGVGLLTPGVEKILPLSQSCALLMQDSGSSFGERTLSRDEVRGINNLLASKCRHLLFGRDIAHLRRIVADSGVDKQKWRSYRSP